MLVAGHAADGINGAGVLVEKATAQASDQGCIADASLQVFHYHAFAGVGLNIQVHTVFQQTGALVFGSFIDRSCATGDIPDADASFEGFAHAEAGHFLHRVDAIVEAAALVVGDGAQLLRELGGERYTRGKLFQFRLLCWRQIQLVVCLGDQGADQQGKNEQMAKKCHASLHGHFIV